jgi:hypothetical protein
MATVRDSGDWCRNCSVASGLRLRYGLRGVGMEHNCDGLDETIVVLAMDCDMQVKCDFESAGIGNVEIDAAEVLDGFELNSAGVVENGNVVALNVGSWN